MTQDNVMPGTTAARYSLRRKGSRRDKPRWPVVCVLALILVSDFQFRLRDNDQAVSGNADPFVLLEIATYGMVALFLFTRFRPAPTLHRAGKLTVLAYAYAVVLVVSAVYSPYLMLALVRAGQVVVVVALCRSIVRHTDATVPHRIAHAYLALIAGAVVFGALFPFPRLPSQPDRFTWLYVHPVQAGEMIAIALVISGAYLLTGHLERLGPRWPTLTYATMFAICLGGLVATKTRGAILGAAVGVAVLLWMRWRGPARFEFAVVGAIVLVVIAASSSEAILEFFARGESVERLATLNSRTDLWTAAFQLWAERPLYGYGLAASRGLFLDTIGLGGGHNALVNLMVDTGLVGALTWLALLVAIVVAASRLARRSGTGRADGTIVLAVLLGMIANSIFTDGLGAPANVSCTWLYLLVAWVILGRGASGPPVAARARTGRR